MKETSKNIERIQTSLRKDHLKHQIQHLKSIRTITLVSVETLIEISPSDKCYVKHKCYASMYAVQNLFDYLILTLIEPVYS